MVVAHAAKVVLIQNSTWSFLVYLSMSPRFLVIFALLLCFFKGQSQHHFGVRADAGVSTLLWQDNFFGPDTKKTFYPQFSWRAGVTYNYRFKKYSALGIDILFSSIKGKQTVEDVFGPAARYAFGLTEKLPYISIPLYYTFHYKRFSASLGVDYMHFLCGYVKLRTSSMNPGYNSYSNYILYRNYWSYIIYPSDFGLYAGLNYNFYRRWTFSLNLYYGLTNILKDRPEFFPLHWQILQGTAGLKYWIHISKSKSKKNISVRDMD